MRLCIPAEATWFLKNTIHGNQVNMECSVVPFATGQSNLNNLDLNSESIKLYIAGTDEYAKLFAENLNWFPLIKGCNIPLNRYFLLISLADWATMKKFSVAGIIRKRNA